MSVRPEKWAQLREELAQAGIEESDLEERFLLASGSGGQKVQKTRSSVQLTHKPSNTTIKCEKTRSREDNRFFARRLLLERLTGQEKRAAKQTKIAKQKARRKRRTRSGDPT